MTTIRDDFQQTTFDKRNRNDALRVNSFTSSKGPHQRPMGKVFLRKANAFRGQVSALTAVADSNVGRPYNVQ